MIHHDARPYDQAVRESGEKFKALVVQGPRRAAQVIQKIREEVPVDTIVPGGALHFEPREKDVAVSWEQGAPLQPIHRNALGQLADRAKIPMAYVKTLLERGDWGRGLLAENLRTVYGKQGGRYLARSHGGTLRGFLSDKYRRLDSRPLVDAFCGAAQSIGAVPIEGNASETRVAIKAFLPQVFEPVPGDKLVAFGLVWENSDYGNGAHTVRAFMLRLYCTNFAIGEDTMRQVHLGGRLRDDVQYRERTYRLDAQATASALEDTVKHALGPKVIDAKLATIRAAHETKVEAGKPLIERLRKAGLQKGEAEKANEVFIGGTIEQLPPTYSTWRMSNAVSWLAGETDDQERKLELEKIAGAVLPKAA